MKVVECPLLGARPAQLPARHGDQPSQFLAFGHTLPSATCRADRKVPAAVSQRGRSAHARLTRARGHARSQPMMRLGDSVRAHLVADVEVGVF